MSGGYPPKTERNNAMLAEYLAGDWVPEIAGRYGITPSRVYMILRRMGAFADTGLVQDRIALRNRLIARREEVRQAKREAMKRLHAAGLMRGKPVIFGNDPERREQYLSLREVYGASYAREAMGLAA